MAGVKERILLFITECNITTAEFERTIGVSGGYIKNISKSMQPDILEKISNIYPLLSIEWLIVGKGNMLKLSISEIELDPKIQEEIISLRAENKLLRELVGLGERKDNNIKTA